MLDYRKSLRSYKGLFGGWIKVSLFLITIFCPQILIAKGNIKGLFRDKNYKKVVDLYGRRYSNLSVSNLFLLSQSYKKLNLLKKQIQILKIIDGKSPNNFKVHKALADSSKKLAYRAILNGEEYKLYAPFLDDMIFFYQSAIQLNPNNEEVYKDLMGIYIDQENINEGLALAQKMKKKFGERKDVVFYLCQWNSKYGLVDQTKSACEKSKKLSPKDPRPRIYNAIAYQDSGDQGEFRKRIFSIYRKFPSNSEIIDMVGQIHTESENFEAAEKVLLKNKNSSIERSRINLVNALYKNKKYKKALKYFSKSCSQININRKKYIRSFESNLRNLEHENHLDLALKFRKEVSKCRSQPIKGASRKVNFTHFSEGIRLPANARDIEGRTLSEKKYNYDKERREQRKKSPQAKTPQGKTPQGKTP